MRRSCRLFRFMMGLFDLFCWLMVGVERTGPRRGGGEVASLSTLYFESVWQGLRLVCQCAERVGGGE
jgi:hypothetical protein